MNLATPIGQREVMTYGEVGKSLGMTYNQVRHLTLAGKLKRRFSGTFPFYYEDVNRFIMDLNSGKVRLGRGGSRKAVRV